jgi:H+-translocating diphosphatase
MAAAAILPELGTQVLIPVAAAVGIAFSVLQWVLVSKVRLAPERRADGGGAVKSGPSDYLIEEEEGLNDHNVVVKCAEIQNAISEGEKPGAVFL